MIFIWDDTPGENVEHIAEHDVTPEEVEEAYADPRRLDTVSRGSGLPAFYGRTRSRRRLFVTYTEDDGYVSVVTAYEVD